ncbi:MAG: hypothetical protein KBD83_02680 [Gammaproteobacteria bacterium]|nr:hypothetical protein [Gammaproteobacteria bacterium]
MTKASIFGGNKNFSPSLLIVSLPEDLIDYILDFSDARENTMMASSCLAMWNLLNKNRHWFIFTGMYDCSEGAKKLILASKKITVDPNVAIPEYAAKEFFLRTMLANHNSTGYTECHGLESGIENTKSRDMLINSYKHIVALTSVAYQFFRVLRSKKVYKFLDLILLFWPYLGLLFISACEKMLLIDGGIVSEKLPNICLLKSALTEDILQVQNNTLLIIRQNNEDFIFYYMDPVQGFSSRKVHPSFAEDDNLNYRELCSLFLNMQSNYLILPSPPYSMLTDGLHRKLIKMIREMKVPVHRIPIASNSAGLMCLGYAFLSFLPSWPDLGELLRTAFSIKHPPLAIIAVLFLPVILFLSVYFFTKKIIESCYGPITANRQLIDCLPKNRTNLHHEFFSARNCSVYFQSTTAATIDSGWRLKKDR